MKLGRPLLAIITYVFVVLSPAMAQTTPAFFGMSDYIHRPLMSNWEPYPSVPFAHLRSFDAYTEWWIVEPSRGSYSWANLDWLVGLAEQHNQDLLYTMAMTPRWASSDPNNAGCHLANKGAYGSCAAPAN